MIPSPALHVTAYDRDGGPIDGCSISVKSDMEETWALTSNGGVAAIPLPEGSSYLLTVVASSDGYCPTEKRIARSTQQTSIVLERPTDFQGRVVLSAGGAPEQELLVFAWPMTLTWDPPVELFVPWILAEELELSHGIVGSRTRVDGSFTLLGVDPGQDYYIMAGGAGCISDAQPMAYPDGEEEMTLVASNAFGSIIEVVSDTGLTLDSDSLRRSQSMYFGSIEGQVEACSVGGLGLFLAANERVDLDAGSWQQLCLFRGPGSESGVCLFHLQLPGCDAIDLRWNPPSLALGLEKVRAVLSGCPQATGMIDVVPSGASPEMIVRYRDYLSVYPPGSGAKLTLVDQTTSEAFTFGMAMTGLDGAIRIANVPTGRYTARYEHIFGGFQYPTDESIIDVLILESQVVAVTVDFSRCAQVELELIAADGAPYEERARWSIGRGDPQVKASGHLGFPSTAGTLNRPPYLSGLLNAGKYTLKGSSPSWAATPEQGFRTLDVQSGTLNRVRVQLPRNAR